MRQSLLVSQVEVGGLGCRDDVAYTTFTRLTLELGDSGREDSNGPDEPLFASPTFLLLLPTSTAATATIPHAGDSITPHSHARSLLHYASELAAAVAAIDHCACCVLSCVRSPASLTRRAVPSTRSLAPAVFSLVSSCLMSFSLPAGFGHYELFDNATFGEAEIDDLLRLFPAFSSHPIEAERSLLVQQLRDMGRVERQRNERRRWLRETERRRLEIEESNAAMERSIQRNRETARRTATPHALRHSTSRCSPAGRHQLIS